MKPVLCETSSYWAMPVLVGRRRRGEFPEREIFPTGLATQGYAKIFWVSNFFVPSPQLSLFQNRKTLGTRFYFVNQWVRSFCSNVPMFQDSEQGLGRGRGYTQRHLRKNKMKSFHASFTLRLFPIHYFWNIGTNAPFIYIFIKNYYYYSNKIKHLRSARSPKS